MGSRLVVRPPGAAENLEEFGKDCGAGRLHRRNTPVFQDSARHRESARQGARCLFSRMRRLFFGRRASHKATKYRCPVVKEPFPFLPRNPRDIFRRHVEVLVDVASDGMAKIFAVLGHARSELQMEHTRSDQTYSVTLTPRQKATYFLINLAASFGSG